MILDRSSRPFSNRVLHHLGSSIAFFLYFILRLRRSLVRRNLDIAFDGALSSKEKDRIGFLSYYHFTMTILEFFHDRSGRLGENVSFRGEEHIENALNQKKGVYVLCCHMGSWEAMASAMSRRLVPTHVLVKKVGNSFLNSWITKQRIKNGFFPVLRKKKGDGLKAIIDILSRGEVVGFVMDQSRPGEPFLPFFGHPAKTNTSFAAIWRKHPAPIIPAFIIRKDTHRHEVTLLPEVHLNLTDNQASDVLAHSQIFNQCVESIVRMNPEQYFWVHDRWKGDSKKI